MRVRKLPFTPAVSQKQKSFAPKAQVQGCTLTLIQTVLSGFDHPCMHASCLTRTSCAHSLFTFGRPIAHYVWLWLCVAIVQQQQEQP